MSARSARSQLDSAHIAPAALDKITALHADTIREIEEAVRKHDVVVVGMAQNPHVKKARKALEAAGFQVHYLEYGSYFSDWRRRLAIKLWSGWPTFPQVFVKGTLIGGEELTRQAIASGDIARRLEK